MPPARHSFRAPGTARPATTKSDTPSRPTPPTPTPASVPTSQRQGSRSEEHLIPRITQHGARFYDVGGKLFPSVTTILQVIGKPALVPWAAREERLLVAGAAADVYLELLKNPPLTRHAFLAVLEGKLGKARANQRLLAQAGEIGTQVHAACEWHFRTALGQAAGPEPKLEDKALWAYMAFEDWAKSVHLKPLAIEQVVFSTRHEYAGTLDLLAEINGVVTVVDFKTGRSIYAESHLQNVAYRVALAEMGQARATQGLIVRLPKVDTDPAFETQSVPSVPDLFPAFVAALKLWRWWYAQEAAYRTRQTADRQSKVTAPPAGPDTLRPAA